MNFLNEESLTSGSNLSDNRLMQEAYAKFCQSFYDERSSLTDKDCEYSPETGSSSQSSLHSVGSYGSYPSHNSCYSQSSVNGETVAKLSFGDDPREKDFSSLGLHNNVGYAAVPPNNTTVCSIPTICRVHSADSNDSDTEEGVSMSKPALSVGPQFPNHHSLPNYSQNFDKRPSAASPAGLLASQSIHNAPQTKPSSHQQMPQNKPAITHVPEQLSEMPKDMIAYAQQLYEESQRNKKNTGTSRYYKQTYSHPQSNAPASGSPPSNGKPAVGYGQFVEQHKQLYQSQQAVDLVAQQQQQFVGATAAHQAQKAQAQQQMLLQKPHPEQPTYGNGVYAHERQIVVKNFVSNTNGQLTHKQYHRQFKQRPLPVQQSVPLTFHQSPHEILPGPNTAVYPPNYTSLQPQVSYAQAPSSQQQVPYVPHSAQQRRGGGGATGTAAGFIYVVQFKRHSGEYLLSTLCMDTVQVADPVIVNADKGLDCGFVGKILSPDEYNYATGHYFDYSANNPNRNNNILRKAHQTELTSMMKKTTEESDILAYITQIAKKDFQLKLEFIDAEFQFDRKKLTFYYVNPLNCNVNSREVDDFIHAMHYTCKARITLQLLWQ